MKSAKPRDDIVKTQAEIMLALIEQNKNKLNLKAIILEHVFPEGRSLKPDAIKLAIDHLKEEQYSPSIIKIADEIFIEQRIGKVKHKELEEVVKKEVGESLGKIVKKPLKSSHIMQKSGRLQDDLDVNDKPIKKTFDTSAEDAFEYISSQAANLIMPDKSPKVRLHKDKHGKVTLLSKFLDDFKPAGTVSDDGKDITLDKEYITNIKNPRELGRFFAANMLLGERDQNPGNIDPKLRRIDFGQSAFFAKTGGETFTASEYKEYIEFNFLKMFPDVDFLGPEFAQGILDVTQSYDINQYRQTIRLSLKNLAETHGENFFNTSEFKEVARSRLGIPPSTKLTPKLLEDAFMFHQNNTKYSLEERAHSQLRTHKLLVELGAAEALSPIEATTPQKENISANHQILDGPTLVKKYLDELEKIFNDPNRANVEKNATRIAQIKALQVGSEDHKVAKETHDEPKIEGISLLKYARLTGRDKLAVEMSKVGFKVNKSELPDLKTKEAILVSNNLIRRVFKNLTRNDKKREEVIGTRTVKDLEGQRIDLSKKPSPLYIAMQTGQLKLALEMIDQGFTLKQSEINKYAKERETKIKQDVLSTLGFRKRKHSEELIALKIEEDNNKILPPTHTPRINKIRHRSQ